MHDAINYQYFIGIWRTEMIMIFSIFKYWAEILQVDSTILFLYIKKRKEKKNWSQKYRFTLDFCWNTFYSKNTFFIFDTLKMLPLQWSNTVLCESLGTLVQQRHYYLYLVIYIIWHHHSYCWGNGGFQATFLTVMIYVS